MKKSSKSMIVALCSFLVGFLGVYVGGNLLSINVLVGKIVALALGVAPMILGIFFGYRHFMLKCNEEEAELKKKEEAEEIEKSRAEEMLEELWIEYDPIKYMKETKTKYKSKHTSKSTTKNTDDNNTNYTL